MYLQSIYTQITFAWAKKKDFRESRVQRTDSPRIELSLLLFLSGFQT